MFDPTGEFASYATSEGTCNGSVQACAGQVATQQVAADAAAVQTQETETASLLAKVQGQEAQLQKDINYDNSFWGGINPMIIMPGTGPSSVELSQLKQDLANLEYDATLGESTVFQYAQATGKTAAYAAGKFTLSGWGNSADIPAEITRVAPQEVMALQQEIGFPARAAGAFDRGVPGQYYASHAERQAYMLEPGEPITVSNEVCSNCQAFFQQAVNDSQAAQTVIDPIQTWSFAPQSVVDEVAQVIADNGE
jgi:hypothetical protein